MSERYALVHLPSRTTVATVEKATNWWTLGVGVIGRSALPIGEGLWLPGVASVHTCFVRFPLDLVFLDQDFRVLKIIKAAPPWKLLLRCSRAYHVIELGEGTLSSKISLSIEDGCSLTLMN